MCIRDRLYTAAQLCIRKYVGRFRLDELLVQKDEIGRSVCEQLKAEQDDYCVEILNAGIKDIILPGEIRDIMNTVLVAEKKAQANVIMRREEVASTKSLLNTAKLMDENKKMCIRDRLQDLHQASLALAFSLFVHKKLDFLPRKSIFHNDLLILYMKNSFVRKFNLFNNSFINLTFFHININSFYQLSYTFL